MKYNPVRSNLFTMSDLFDDMFPSVESHMKTDIVEYEGGYKLTMDLPGYKKEDIEISMKNGNLTIQAEHNNSEEEKDEEGNIIRQERYVGKCSRSFYVGDNVDIEKIDAVFKDGTLSIELPHIQKEVEDKTIIDIG